MAETSYQVLARKWRPQSFAELAGLEHIARTLQNAIRRDRVAHAFIFTGSRGVGKTSAARILAKALNCAAGPAPEPCNQCDNCRAITAGTAPDVIEIDGASNRGVGEIRLLRDGVSYLPQAAPYKIYIIDEVHMLTTEAFNALLKTLEEPPAHVKFIMATTDVHKVPMTILSRCQRFDFGRLSQATIAGALVDIGARENLDFEPGTVELLAREARGSMRDALSLLDQVSAYAGEKITVADLRAALGLIEARHCQDLLEAIVAGDLAAAVGRISDLEQAGADLKDFAKEFLFFLRDALFIKLSGRLEKLLEVGPEEAAALRSLVDTRELPYWQQLFALWEERYSGIHVAQIPRLALEMAVVELGMARDLKPLDELLAGLEKRLAPDPAGRGGSAPAGEKKPTPAAGGPGSRTGSRPEKRSAGRVETGVIPPAAPPEAEPVSAPASEAPPWEVPADRPTLVRETAVLRAPTRTADRTPEWTETGPVEPETAKPETTGPGTAGIDVDGGKPIAGAAPAPAGPEAVPSASSGDELTAERWEGFLAYLGRHDRRLGAMLKGSRLKSREGEERLEIAVAPYALTSLEHESAGVAEHLALFLGRPSRPRLEFVAANGGSDRQSTPTAAAARGRGRLPGKEEIFKDEAVRFISDRFGGRVTEIRPRR